MAAPNGGGASAIAYASRAPALAVNYRTSRVRASRPPIITASPGPCDRTARASGDTWETVPRGGLASSSPDLEHLVPAVVPAQCEGPAERSLGFVGRQFDNFRTREPRLPITDFSRCSRHSFSIAYGPCRAVGGLKAAECCLYIAKPDSVTKLRWGDIGRSGSSTVSASLTKARLIGADGPWEG